MEFMARCGCRSETVTMRWNAPTGRKNKAQLTVDDTVCQCSRDYVVSVVVERSVTITSWWWTHYQIPAVELHVLGITMGPRHASGRAGHLASLAAWIPSVQRGLTLDDCPCARALASSRLVVKPSGTVTIGRQPARPGVRRNALAICIRIPRRETYVTSVYKARAPTRLASLLSVQPNRDHIAAPKRRVPSVPRI